MTSNRATSNQGQPNVQTASNYYTLLGLHPSASGVEIRRAYRELSKRYHPDTTELAPQVATEKFQEINQAYATLSNVEQRKVYDQNIGYSRLYVIQPLPELHRQTTAQSKYRSSAYLDPTERPLSAGEIFALFILAIAFIGCLLLAIAVALTRPETVLKPISIPGEEFIQPQTLESQPEAFFTLRAPHIG
ncbi:J domain-containing protein [Desertifilum sp. FACHB-1129]|uniref:Molecular chaperone DnaJ n=2 Tax=Desertifilum tharense IPPAS B-1220 TaxID=1781255 RepID=A0A1E5QLG1_9CYAN|nr:J domain-containing protein [Desertifilum tharense]MBD2313782.1 J domain-containing protein [Desertifilum sp. FACHB-1129]MBD2324507.1 J domain-containing protein [Desertifilum sp. FACHB-866]MBD2334521.1 J domain-containing protein [Desertifilum sp. FACHB-868]MDA0209950.1 J domain-containing protein [Cyanobacteria bacterium FC1]MDK3155111.1 J domain-containing protein [Kamptonema cortianum]